MKQAIIYFKNGTKDWIDPIDKEEDIFYGESIVVITNGANQKYVYDKDSIINIVLVELDEK